MKKVLIVSLLNQGDFSADSYRTVFPNSGDHGRTFFSGEEKCPLCGHSIRIHKSVGAEFGRALPNGICWNSHSSHEVTRYYATGDEKRFQLEIEERDPRYYVGSW